MTTTAGPTLVVLAAGAGSRYGGLKQLEAVGPAGATLMDYAVFDAARAGFSDAVFVVRPDMDPGFRDAAAARYGDRVRVRTVHQRIEDVPRGSRVVPRTRPWGTAHAVLAVAKDVRGPFAVVNADDFYGSAAYETVHRFLRTEANAIPPVWGVVAYRLRDTISAHGGVNRAVCRQHNGYLASLKEVTDIVPAERGFAGRVAGGPLALSGEELVSMNLWAFNAEVFDILSRGFADFLAGSEQSGEYLIPNAVQAAMRRNEARVRVLQSGGGWFGMTHAADRPAVADALAALVAAGKYPERLW